MDDETRRELERLRDAVQADVRRFEERFRLADIQMNTVEILTRQIKLNSDRISVLESWRYEVRGVALAGKSFWALLAAVATAAGAWIAAHLGGGGK